MPDLSRRSLLRLSTLAVFSACAPELFAQQRRRRATLENVTGDDPPPDLTVDQISEFVEDVERSRAYTLEIADAMPPDHYGFMPAPQMRTFGQQMVHTAEALKGMFELFVEGKAAPTKAFSEGGQEVVRSKPDVAAQLAAAFDYVVRGSNRLTDSMLGERIAFTDGRQMSKHRLISVLLDHTTHHRSQCVVYLRLAGHNAPQYRF